MVWQVLILSGFVHVPVHSREYFRWDVLHWHYRFDWYPEERREVSNFLKVSLTASYLCLTLSAAATLLMSSIGILLRGVDGALLKLFIPASHYEWFGSRTFLPRQWMSVGFYVVR